MPVSSYLESLPIFEIAKYNDGPPKNAVPFVGFPQHHPSEKSKLLLVYDPLGVNPQLMEFDLSDVLYAKEIHSAITENGEGVPMIKLWIRRGARGVILEPFEVDSPIKFIHKNREFQNGFTSKDIFPVTRDSPL